MGCLYQWVTVPAFAGMLVSGCTELSEGARWAGEAGRVAGGVACVVGGVIGGVVAFGAGGVCAPATAVKATRMAGMIKVLMMLFPFSWMRLHPTVQHEKGT